MKFLYGDCECSGLSPEKNAMVQLSGMIVVDGNLMEEFNFFIRPFPDDELIEESLAICGLTKEQVLSDKKFEDPKIVHEKLTTIFKRYVNKFDKTDKFYFFAYNARFDVDFLRAWFLKNGDKYMGSYLWFPPIDVMNCAAKRAIGRRADLQNFKLMTVAKFFGIKVDEESAHDSMYDIKITRELMQRLQQIDRDKKNE